MLPVKRSEERKFWKALCRLFQRLIDEIKGGNVLLNGVSQKTREFLRSDEVDRYLNRTVSKMTSTLRVDSARSWREAASKSGNGREMLGLMRNEMKGPVGERIWQIVSENAAYIKTLPQEWALYASQYAAREALKGKRPEEVEAELRKVLPPHITKNLKTIARTECAKANAAIIQARAEMCGIRAYVWRCVMDERSRKSHKLMDGVLVFYDDPPSPEALAGEKSYGQYHAGNTFNCRCYQEPVVDANFLPETLRVYKDGRIFTTTRSNVLHQYGEIVQ